MLRQFLLTICLFSTVTAYPKPGPEIRITRGEVWPKPLWQDDTGNFFAVDPEDFLLLVTNQNCDLLQRAVFRYTKIIEESANSPFRVETTKCLKTIPMIEVNLTKPCEQYPHHGMDESYYVHGHGQVVANSIWGTLRGLETLSQLLVPMSNGMLRIPETEIYDEPRYTYRGLMLDTARHYISVPKITQLLDAMAYNKMNVFHWHMTDDSAFPYNSTKFPELSDKGAFNYKMTYSNIHIAMIVEYAQLRGIRVIPEFDTPAHTASWGPSHPELMTECSGEHKGVLGPFDPTRNGLYDFLQDFFSEIKDIFPDEYIHLGGDEVDSACWESSSSIAKYLEEHRQNVADLPYMYFEKLTANISSLDRMPILWQEAIELNPGMNLPAGTIAQVWYNYKKAMPSLTKRGYTTILSDGFYLYSGDDGPDWMSYYKVEPTDFVGLASQKKLIAGGEACLWTEWVNDYNVISVAFPRASAVAERLWSEKAHNILEEAAPRMEEHNCRMIWRGIESRPANGYGLC